MRRKPLRMSRRRLVLLGALTSLFLSTAIALSWVRSFRGDRWEQRSRITFHRGPADDGTFLELSSWRGSVQLKYVHGPRFRRDKPGDRFGGVADLWGARLTTRGRLGFAWHRDRPGPRALLRIPHWALVIGSLLPTGGILLRWRRNWLMGSRVAAGLCASCGYDTRASPDRCPECGTVPATAA